MLTRADLETPRTPEEMGDILYSVLRNHDTRSSKAVILGKGLYKDLFEEYWPLCYLALHLHACSAYLTPKSSEGPDGVIRVVTGEEIHVQITVSDESHQTALTRELISQGRLAFLTTKKTRHPRTGEIVEGGGAFMRPQGYLLGKVQEVVNAITRKLPKYHEGTHELLVSTSVIRPIDKPDIPYNWREDLKERVRELGSIPYSKLYVANREEIIEITGYKT